MASDQEKIENKLIDWIALESNGRLIVFKPELGPDLIVQKKGVYDEKKLSFTIVNASDVEEKKYGMVKSDYMIFANYDEVRQDISEKILLISPADFEKIVGVEQVGIDVITKDFNQDKRFLNYLMDKNSFTLFLIKNLISESKPGAKAGFKGKKY